IISRLQPESIDSTIGQAGDVPYLVDDKPPLATRGLREVNEVQENEIAKLNRELDERSRTSDAQRVELVALKIQIESLKQQLSDIGKRRVQEPIGVARRGGGLRLAG